MASINQAKTAPTKARAREMTEAQRAYEERRAAKAGVSLDKWLEQKRRAEAQEKAEREKATAAPVAPKKPGLLSRLIDRAHKPL